MSRIVSVPPQQRAARAARQLAGGRSHDSRPSPRAANFWSAARDRLLGSRTSSAGLAVFRIAYGGVLFGEVMQLIYFRPLIFGDLPHLPAAETSFAYVLWAWAAAVACLILGLFTRIACIVNYVLTLATLSTFQHYEYHADHIYIGLNLLLIFTPVARRLSLDALVARIKSGESAGAPPPDTTVARFHYDSLVLVGLGLVYFDSFFWKLGQELWKSGLGLWLPMSLPHDTWLSVPLLNAVLNRQTLVGVLSDLTLVFEATFIALVWLRAARPILCLIGVGMHLSIFLAFPIPFFGLSLAAMYFLLAPAGWYEAAARAVRRSTPRCVVYFDIDSPRWRRWLLFLEHFDFRRSLAFRPLPADLAAELPGGLLVVAGTRRYSGTQGILAALRCHPLLWPFASLVSAAVWIGDRSSDADHQAARATRTLRVIDVERLTAGSDTAGRSGEPLGGDGPKSIDTALIAKLAIVSFCIFVQATLIPNAPYFRDPQAAAAATASSSWLPSVQRFAHGYAGICSHPIFLDGHFDTYDHIVAVTLLHPDGSETWLPLTRPSGQMGWYATGRIWAKWAFRGNSPYVWPEGLKLTLRDLTAFWAMKNDVKLTDARFKILVKKYDPHTGWERDYLRRQAEKPWQLAGFVYWRGGQFSAEIMDIEAM